VVIKHNHNCLLVVADALTFRPSSEQHKKKIIMICLVSETKLMYYDETY